MDRLRLVRSDDDMVGRDTAAVGVDSVVLKPVHCGALENLQAVLNEQILETLHTQQRIDTIGLRVANAAGEFLGAEDALQAIHVVKRLVGEADALPTFHFLFDGFLRRSCRVRGIANPASAARIRCRIS